MSAGGDTATRSPAAVRRDQLERARAARQQRRRVVTNVPSRRDRGLGARPGAVAAHQLDASPAGSVADELADHVRREIRRHRRDTAATPGGRVVAPRSRGAAVEPGGRRVERRALGDQRHRIVALGDRRLEPRGDALAHHRHHRRAADEHELARAGPGARPLRGEQAEADLERAIDQRRAQRSTVARVSSRSTSTSWPSIEQRLRERDLGLVAARQLDLRVLGGEPQRAQRAGVLRVVAAAARPRAATRGAR